MYFLKPKWKINFCLLAQSIDIIDEYFFAVWDGTKKFNSSICCNVISIDKDGNFKQWVDLSNYLPNNIEIRIIDKESAILWINLSMKCIRLIPQPIDNYFSKFIHESNVQT